MTLSVKPPSSLYVLAESSQSLEEHPSQYLAEKIVSVFLAEQ